LLAVALVPPKGNQLYVYGAAPPVAVTVALPLALLLHFASVADKLTLKFICEKEIKCIIPKIKRENKKRFLKMLIFE
jgi:hypothetical protein